MSASTHKAKPLRSIDLKLGPHIHDNGQPLSLIWQQDDLDGMMLGVPQRLIDPVITQKRKELSKPAFISEALNINSTHL